MGAGVQSILGRFVGGGGSGCLRITNLVLVVLGMVTFGGCASNQGEVFAPLEEPILWPRGAAEARIAYVGSLSTDRDLKASQSFMEGLGSVLFGAKEGHGMVSPFAVCTDGPDRVFVSDVNAQTVHVFDLARRKYEQWKPNAGGDYRFQQPVGVVYDSFDRLLVSDSVAGTIFAFDQRGKYLGHFGEDSVRRPSGIAFDGATNRLFVVDSETHELVVLGMDGELIQRVGKRGSKLGQFNFPTNVAIGNDGRIYVSDSLNFRVQVFDSELQPVRQIGRKGDMPGYFSLPKGLAVDSEGHLYVVDAQFETVQVFDEAGRLLMSFGDEGHGPGQFWLPAGIFVDGRDRIWVADSYNRRVQVFDYLSQQVKP